MHKEMVCKGAVSAEFLHSGWGFTLTHDIYVWLLKRKFNYYTLSQLTTLKIRPPFLVFRQE